MFPYIRSPYRTNPLRHLSQDLTVRRLQLGIRALVHVPPHVPFVRTPDPIGIEHVLDYLVHVALLRVVPTVDIPRDYLPCISQACVVLKGVPPVIEAKLSARLIHNELTVVVCINDDNVVLWGVKLHVCRVLDDEQPLWFRFYA